MPQARSAGEPASGSAPERAAGVIPFPRRLHVMAEKPPPHTTGQSYYPALRMFGRTRDPLHHPKWQCDSTVNVSVKIKNHVSSTATAGLRVAGRSIDTVGVHSCALARARNPPNDAPPNTDS